MSFEPHDREIWSADQICIYIDWSAVALSNCQDSVDMTSELIKGQTSWIAGIYDKSACDFGPSPKAVGMNGSTLASDVLSFSQIFSCLVIFRALMPFLNGLSQWCSKQAS